MVQDKKYQDKALHVRLKVIESRLDKIQNELKEQKTINETIMKIFSNLGEGIL